MPLRGWQPRTFSPSSWIFVLGPDTFVFWEMDGHCWEVGFKEFGTWQVLVSLSPEIPTWSFPLPKDYLLRLRKS